MADLTHISRALSQYGRHGDDHLVHMSSREIAALSAMSPRGQLTRNPDTGLPEAFSLTDIIGPLAGIATAIFAPELLPFVAGAAGIGTAIGTGDIGKGIMAGLSSYGLGSLGGMAAGALGLGAGAAASVAAPNIAAEAAGNLGDLSALGATPSIGLGGSLASGASGYSQLAADFGGLASGPTAAMAAAAQQAPVMTGIGGAAGLPQIAGGPASTGGIMSFIKNNPWAVPAATMAMGAMSPNGSGNYAPEAVNQPKGPSTPLVQGPVARNATMPNGYVMGGPEPNFFPTQQNNPAMAAPAYVQQAQALNALQSPTQSLAHSAQGGGGLGSSQQQALMTLQEQQRQAFGMADGGDVPEKPRDPNDFGLGSSAPQWLPASHLFNYGTNWNWIAHNVLGMAKGGRALPPTTQIYPQMVGMMPQHGPRSMGMRHMADGGGVGGGLDEATVRNLVAEAKAAVLGQSDHPQEAIQRFQSVFGPEALQELVQSVQGAGGAVQGPGDGSSDSVPGTIDGTQPVQLSNSEHVIPADAVAHLGNGSSTEGHRLLKQMTARVRSAKTGRSGMPKRIKPQGYMPG